MMISCEIIKKSFKHDKFLCNYFNSIVLGLPIFDYFSVATEDASLKMLKM